MISAVVLMLCMMVFEQDPPKEMQAGMLTIQVDNLKNKSGQIGISVYNTSKGWPDKWEQAFHSELVPIESVPAQIELPDLLVGRYAVSVIHDENSSGGLDKNFMSIPKEGYGVSNNVKPRSFGPPEFEKSVFLLTQSDTLISIKMNY